MAPIIVTGGDSSTAGEFVQLPKTEYDELETRASQSSQNFERLKKANETLEEYEARVGPLDQLNAPPNSGGTDEDKRVEALETKVAGLSHSLAMAEVLKAFPVIEGKEQDFNEFRAKPENAGMSLATAAKAFVFEKDLIAPRRPGLEAPTGGDPAPVRSGKMSSADAAKLRASNFKAYSEGIRNGTIIIED